MIGALIGDITGSRWEAGKPEPGTFEFFPRYGIPTDDTICTLAVAEALLSDRDFVPALRRWVAAYPHEDYGSRFKMWALSAADPANASPGNGAAMRVSPIALLASGLDEALALAESSAASSHDHPQAIAGARCIAALAILARDGAGQSDLLQAAQQFGWGAPKPPEGFSHSVEAVDTVPVACWAAITGTSFEDAIERAAYVGGDTDTICCMTGSIAEHRFGVPQNLIDKAVGFLDARQAGVLLDAYEAASADRALYVTAQGGRLVGRVAVPPAAPSNWSWRRLFG